MRTTVNIDDQLLAEAKARARERGVSLGDVIDESLQTLLTRPVDAAEADLPTFDGGGPLSGVDYTSNASMLEAADGHVSAVPLRS